MAYVFSSESSFTDSSASVVVKLPAHNQNDLLIIGYDSRYGGTITDPAGWIKLTNNNSSSSVGRVYYKIAGASETNPTIGGTGGQDSAAVCLCIKGADTIDPIPTGAWGQSSLSNTKVIFPSVTPFNSNSLVVLLNTVQTDYDNSYFEAGIVEVNTIHSITHAYVSTGYTNYQGAVTPAYEAWQEIDGSFPYGAVTIAVKDDGTDINKGYSDPLNKPVDLIHPLTLKKGGHISLVGEVDMTTLVPSVTNTNSGNTITTRNEVFNSGDPLSINPYIQATSLNTQSSDSPNMNIRGSQLSVAPNLSNKILSIRAGGADIFDTMANSGRVFGISDGTNASTWLLDGSDSQVNTKTGNKTFLIDLVAGTEIDTHGAGSLNLATADTVYFGFKASDYTNTNAHFGHIYSLNALTMLGGTASSYCSFIEAKDCARGAGLGTIENQSNQTQGQFFSMQSIQLGNGTDSLKWKSSTQSLEFPAAYDYSSKFIQCQLSESALEFSVKASSSCEIDLSSTTINFGDKHKFTISPSSSTLASYKFNGFLCLNSEVTLEGLGSDIYQGATFSGCNEINLNSFGAGDSLGAVTISNCAEDYAVTVTNEDEWNALQNCTFSGNNYSIKITGNHGGQTWTATNMKFSDNGTHDIQYDGTGTLTIAADANSSIGTTNAPNGTLTITAPDKGIVFTGLKTGSFILVVPTGQVGPTAWANKRFYEASSSTAETYVASVEENVDISILHNNYDPIYYTSVTVDGNMTTLPIQQVEDRAFNAGYGTLAWGDGYELFGAEIRITEIATIQEVYNYTKFVWQLEAIQSASIANIPFPWKANGTASFTLNKTALFDWMFSAASFAFIRRDGVRYYDTVNGYVTDIFSAVWSSGETTGMLGRYQQETLGTPINAQATGDIDQLIHVYQKDVFDYRNHLKVKYQIPGYHEVYVDLVDVYGQMADELYVIAADPKPNGIPTSTAVLDIVVDYLAVPDSWNGKNFRIKITDNIGYTGLQITQMIDYFLSLDVAVDGTHTFNWSDMLFEDGDKFKTGRIDIQGVANDLGVYVTMADGVTPHPDFSKFQSDDGAFFTPSVAYTFTVSGLIDTCELRIYDDNATGINMGTELAGVESNTGTTFAFVHNGTSNTIKVQFIHPDYEEITQSFALGSSNQTLDFNPEPETND